MQHTRDRLVEQIEVVADHEQRAPVLAQEAHQPRLGVDVEVVGGFVETQHVAAGEQDPGQLDPSPLAAREHPDRELHAALVEAEPGGERAGLALGRVAAVELEVLLGPAEPRDVAIVGTLLHGDPQLLDAHQLVVDAAARQHVGDGGARLVRRVDARVLRQVAEAALAHDRATGRLGGAAEHLEQRGLAGAVAADDAHLVAGHHGEGGVGDDEPTTHFHRECLRLEHRTRLRADLRFDAPVSANTWSTPSPRSPTTAQQSMIAATLIAMAVTTTTSTIGRRALLAAPVSCGCSLLAAATYIAVHDPSDGGFWVGCPFRQITGLWCPGCGLTRATHHLLRGDLGTALHFNVLVVLVLGTDRHELDGVDGDTHWGARSTGSGAIPPWTYGAAATASVAFAVVRNLPGVHGLRG